MAPHSLPRVGAEGTGAAGGSWTQRRLLTRVASSWLRGPLRRAVDPETSAARLLRGGRPASRLCSGWAGTEGRRGPAVRSPSGEGQGPERRSRSGACSPGKPTSVQPRLSVTREPECPHLLPEKRRSEVSFPQRNPQCQFSRRTRPRPVSSSTIFPKSPNFYLKPKDASVISKVVLAVFLNINPVYLASEVWWGRW